MIWRPFCIFFPSFFLLFSLLLFPPFSLPSLRFPSLLSKPKSLSLNEGFRLRVRNCMNRLPVAYDPDASGLVRWLQFVNELIYEDDVPAL